MPYSRRRSRRIPLGLGIASCVLVLMAAIYGGLLTHQVLSVRADLALVARSVPQLRAQLEDGEREGMQATFVSMAEHASAARDSATSPLWRAGSILPFLGSNLSAVTEVAVSADDVATGAVGPLLETYQSLDWTALSPTEGQVDVAQLMEAAPALSSASDTIRLSHDRLASIDLSSLMSQVASPIRSATTQLAEVSTAVGTASSAAQLLPAMLGSDSPRTYLVLIQNSAETRATGGIPGALAIIHATDGRIILGEQSSASELGAFKPPIAVDAEQEALYTGRLGTQMQNVNLTPNFSTAAITAKRMWEERYSDQPIDGVIAVDTVVLGHLLEAAGPVEVMDPSVLALIDGTSLPSSLTSENVVSTLLSDVYREIEEPKAQDTYFAAVAGSVFSAFTNGEVDGKKLIEALVTSTREGRLYLWSNSPEEQEIITSTALAGSVEGTSKGGASFGVFYNDGTGAKMDYYASRTVQLFQTCHSDGYSTYTVRVRITNTAPADAESALPSYVTGRGVYGVTPGRIRTNYVVYGPAQAFVDKATVDGKPVPIGSGKHGQRPVGTVMLELGPGETTELDVAFSHVVQDSEPKLQVTPSLESPEETILPFRRAACS